MATEQSQDSYREDLVAPSNETSTTVAVSGDPEKTLTNSYDPKFNSVDRSKALPTTPLTSPRRPFWRTPKGIAALVTLAVLIIVGIVVGVVVGKNSMRVTRNAGVGVGDISGTVTGAAQTSSWPPSTTGAATTTSPPYPYSTPLAAAPATTTTTPYST